MLDYIKSKIQEQLHADDAFQEQQEEALLNETILECAHLVQELDDLSIEGTEAGSSRPFTKIDIPLEDDVEITAVELDALDGRVLSAPMDATVQESDTVYVGLKTYDDFYQEAYGATTQFQRETDDQFANRVEAIASKNYAAYKNYCFQEGLYGFDKLSITDDRVPARVIMECGTLGGKDYSVKLGVDFQSNESTRQIMKKQLDSVIGFRKVDPVMLQEAAFEAFGEKAGVASADNIWDAVTPTRIIVPAVTNDKLFVAIECEIDGTSDTAYLEWYMPVNGGAMHISSANEMDQSKLKSIGLIGKNAAIHIESEMARSGYHAPSRFVQEAIDFGDPDAAPDANPDAPAVSFDAPPADGMEQPAGGDAAPTATADAGTEAPPADGATADAPAEGTDATAEDPNAQPKEPVDTNDVSDQIAEKISDETQNDANADADLNIDGVDATSDVDAPTDENIDAELGEPAPDDTASTEPADETSDVDFDNMTIDELLAQGQEKMKTMTMQQLKDFLQGEASPTADGVPAADDEASVQESFQLVLEGAKEKGQTVRNRISNAMEDMQKNLKTMHEALSKDSTRREIQKLWASVNTSNSETFGVQLGSGIVESTMSAIAGLVSTVASSMSSLFAGGFTSSQTKTYSGENFRKSIQYVDSFLKTATKKKRIKNTFTSEEIGKLTRYREDINDLIDTAEQAFSGGKAAMDVSLKQLDAAVVKVMDQYNSVKSIVTTQAAGDAIIEEAFFLTRGNIGKELDIHLRKALGILNDNEMEIEQLCTAFRKEGKQLNRVVHKASTMKKVFNETECKQLLKLNHCLSDLMTMLRSNIDKGSIMTVKRMIQAFVQEATGVLKMIEQKNNPGKPVQEGFLGNLFRSSKMKAKSVEQICEDLIDMWDVDDSVWNARELSEIVYEKDPMTFHVFIGDWLPESALKCALIVEKCIHDHPAGCNKFKELQEKFENFANRFNDMLATNDDRELTVSEYETLQELKDFIPEMKTTVREFLSEIDQTE